MACPDLRATQGPEEEVESLARACARFVPNFGPKAGRKWTNSGENGPFQPRRQPEWNFATACYPGKSRQPQMALFNRILGTRMEDEVKEEASSVNEVPGAVGLASHDRRTCPALLPHKDGVGVETGHGNGEIAPVEPA